MKKPMGVAIGLLAVVALVFVAIWTMPYWTHASKVVTVTLVDHKLMQEHGKTKDVYLVFTDQGTFKNEDSPAYLKFNSSDLQGRLAEKGKFRIEYYGFRIPVTSTYPNIIKADKLECTVAPCPGITQ